MHHFILYDHFYVHLSCLFLSYIAFFDIKKMFLNMRWDKICFIMYQALWNRHLGTGTWEQALECGRSDTLELTTR